MPREDQPLGLKTTVKGDQRNALNMSDGSLKKDGSGNGSSQREKTF